MSTRQVKRQTQRLVAKIGDSGVRTGVPRAPAVEALVAVGYVVATALRSADDPARAGAAARLAHQMFESSLSKIPSGLGIACRKGCGYCCHTWVGATAPEIFLLAQEVRNRKAKPGTATSMAAVAARAAEASNLNIGERFGAKIPCALLENSSCSVYAVRPGACRQVTSTDLAACIDEYEGRDEGGDVPVSQLYLDHARNSGAALAGALAACGLDGRVYELNAALARALSASDSEARWLAGVDVFAGIAQAPPDDPAIRSVVATIADGIAPLL